MLRPLASLALFATLGGCATQVVATDGSIIRTVRFAETAREDGLQVTPISLVEDSRCPTGVQCIQAGTVRIEARIVDRGGGRTAIIGLGVPARLEGGWVSLVGACPYPVHGTRIAPRDYLFTLALTTAAAPPAVDVRACPTR